MDEERGYGFVVGNSRFLTGLGARFGMTRFCLHGACARFGMTRVYIAARFRMARVWIAAWSGTSFCIAFHFFEGVGLGDVEFGDGGAAERFEMGSAAELLA